MSYFLCGQTGNANRGCEAILRSTVKVLNERNGDIYVATFSSERDRKAVRELGINMISYKGYPTPIHRYICGTIRKVFKKSVVGVGYVCKDLYSHLNKNDVCLNIGGDVYCYGRPLYSIALNRYTSKKGIDNILWCCSIEKDVIRGEIKNDLLKYKYIFAREQLTYQSLLDAGIPKEKVIKVCDPAFFLDKKEVALPDGFNQENTVGLNVSECVIKKDMPLVYENVMHLARHILDNTDMSICLIPHVYDIKKNVCDWPILKRIKADLNSDRVCMVEEEYDCEQLKYIISQCRFMVCARTHASIAAYSTGVPTLVLGYSIKSKGIATDLFGTDENYVVSYKSLTEDHELTKAFSYVVEHEQEIKKRLVSFLPNYKEQLSSAVKTYIKKTQDAVKICDRNLCSGCGACMLSCPQHCITMTPDCEGFLYPKIDMSLCIRCGRCKKTCPVANKKCDDAISPKTFGLINKDDAIRKSSSSGGAFTALANYVISAGGVVFGASFNDKFEVVQTYAETAEDVMKFRGSKYVQSRAEDAYISTKKFLDEGRLVLFSGTPCQIGGLYAYLGCDYKNLITQDFICHGVPSSVFWSKYLKFQENKYSSPIVAVSFRNKKTGWKRFSVSLDFKNNEHYFCALSDDLYMKPFLMNLTLRPACHECSFKNIHRQSDITLADFWGIDKILPEKNDDKGISLLMLHSERAKDIFAELRDEIDVWEVDFKEAIASNPSMTVSAKASPLRDRFIKDSIVLPIDRLAEKYCGRRFSARMRRMIAKMK